MDPADIRAYAQRDWQLLHESKIRAWEQIKATRGLGAALRAVETLRRVARKRDPSWPSAADRQADLETHIRVSLALSSVWRP